MLSLFFTPGHTGPFTESRAGLGRDNEKAQSAAHRRSLDRCSSLRVRRGNGMMIYNRHDEGLPHENSSRFAKETKRVIVFLLAS